MTEVVFREFLNRSEASDAAADHISDALNDALSATPATSLLVSGGTTPGPCFRKLSGRGLHWSSVTIIPSDERWVEPSHEDSNEKLVRQTLQRGHAADSAFLPLYRHGMDPEEAPDAIEDDLRILGHDPAVALLGMGEDGHFASLFPDFDGLGAALDPAGSQLVVTVHTGGSPYVRISLTLAAICQSGSIALLFFGQAKRDVFEAAQSGDIALPVHALLKQSRSPVTVFWAP